MAASQHTKVKVTVSIARSSTLDDGNQAQNHTLTYEADWPNGTADSQANEAWVDTRSLAVGNETHDLTSLTQRDAADASIRSGISIATMKLLWIKNTNTVGGAGLLTVGDGATPFDGAGFLQGTNPTIGVKPGGLLLWIDPEGLTTTSATDLKVAASGATVTHQIAAAGEAT